MNSKSQIAKYPWAALFFAVCCVFFVIKGVHDERLVLQGFDFKPVYSGARCFWKGCNPYDPITLRAVFADAGGDLRDLRPFRPYNPNYPPSSLFWIAPFSALPFTAALHVWLFVSVCLFLIAACLIAETCVQLSSPFSACLLGIFVATSTSLIMLAQPAVPAIGLCVIAIWCFERKKVEWAGVIFFALSLAIKPQIGVFVWPCLLISKHTRSNAYRIAGVAILLAAPGLIWASCAKGFLHWPHDLRSNLIGIAARGNASDPSPANPEAKDLVNLQVILSIFTERRPIYNLAAYSLAGTFVMIWYKSSIRLRDNTISMWMSLATMACIGLLPIYHREYDTRILLLTFPAASLVSAQGGVWGSAARVVQTLVSFFTSAFFVRHYLSALEPHLIGVNELVRLLLLRPIPAVVFLGAIFYLVCLWRADHRLTASAFAKLYRMMGALPR